MSWANKPAKNLDRRVSLFRGDDALNEIDTENKSIDYDEIESGLKSLLTIDKKEIKSSRRHLQRARGPKRRSRMQQLRILLVLVSVALFVRLFFLFYAVPIAFDWDSYHHWQISYLTLKIGLAHGRMWDLTGMEYFWGILPELLQSFLLWISNSTSIMPFRLFNAVVGSLSSGLMYILVRRYYGAGAGVVASLLTAFNTNLVAWDVSGVNEPLGIFFLLLSIVAYEQKIFLCGLFLGFASICRAEFWVLSIGILFCYLVFKRSVTSFVPAFFGWLTAMAPYLYILQTQAGDFIYPLRWNYLASYYAWTGQQPPLIVLPPESMPYKILWAVILVVSLVYLVKMIKKRPSDHIVRALFVGFLLFQGILFTVSYRYVAWPWTWQWLFSPWSPGGLHDRPWMLDYFFLSTILGLISYSKTQPGRVGKRFLISRSTILGSIFILMSITWLLAMVPSYEQLSNSPSGIRFWFGMADIVADSYVHGTVITEAPPMVTYQLIQRGVSPNRILGSMYCPKYYGGNENDTLEWFKKQDATWYIHDPGNELFAELKTEGWGPFILYRQYGAFLVYKVDFSNVSHTYQLQFQLYA